MQIQLHSSPKESSGFIKSLSPSERKRLTPFEYERNTLVPNPENFISLKVFQFSIDVGAYCVRFGLHKES